MYRICSLLIFFSAQICFADVTGIPGEPEHAQKNQPQENGIPKEASPAADEDAGSPEETASALNPIAGAPEALSPAPDDDAGAPEALSPAPDDDASPEEETSPASNQHCKERETFEILSFYVSSALTGADLGVYTTSLFSNRAAESFLPKFLGGLAGAGLVAYLDLWDEPMHYGLPSAVSMGTDVGLLLSYPQILLIDTLDKDGSITVSERSGILLSGLALGGATGYFLGKSADLSPGQSTAIHVGAIWGFGLSAFSGLLIEVYRITDPDFIENDHAMYLYWGLLSAGTLGGAIGGYYLGHYTEPSSTRLWVTTGGGLLGLGVGLISFYEMSEIGVGHSLGLLAANVGVGALGGLALTWYLTKDFEPDRPSCSVGLLPTEKGGAMLGLFGRF